MYKTFLTSIVAIIILFGLQTSNAEAACNYSDYLYPNTNCGQTYQNQYHYTTYTPSYTYNQQSLVAYITQLQTLLAQLQQLQIQNQNSYVVYNSYQPVSDGRSEVDVTTRSASNVEDDRAQLRGEVDFNREDEAVVYFQWGESRSRLNHHTIPVVLDEDDDNESFSQTISRLDRNTTYYFRAVAEDEDGDQDYGSLLSFRTDGRSSSSNDDEPEVETEDAEDITDDSAEIYGRVDMNDFNNGILFFVYGEDEDQIDDIERDYDQYRDIDEDGDDLQKVLVDSDVDGKVDAWVDIHGLDRNTTIYYAMCVEYEDDDDVIICGDTEDFRTDRD